MNALLALPLKQVGGPLWPLWSTLWVTLALVNLMLALPAWGGSGVRPELTQAMGLATGVLMAVTVFGGVTRLARLQRVWQQRLAPSLAQQRLRQAASLGLALAWLGGLPVLLLAALTRGGALPAPALLSAAGVVLCSTVAVGSAWRGNLPWPFAVPALALLVSQMGWGAEAGWLRWLALAAPWHWAVGIAALPLAIGLVQAGRSGRTVPAERLEQSLDRWLNSWRQRHQYLRQHGPHVLGSVIWISVLYPHWISREQAGLEGLLAGVMGMALLTLMAWNLLVGPALHWRHQLAPGRWHRGRLGWQIVGHSLRHHALLALLLLLALVLLQALFNRLPVFTVLAGFLAVGSTLAARWLLAVLLATWLRGLNLGLWTLFGAATLVVAAAAGAQAGLAFVWSTPSLANWAVTAVAALLLLRPIRRAWMTRDLSDYMRPAKAGDAG